MRRETRHYRDWRPIREWLLQEVNALSYKPSLRWCFYRAMGQFGLGKADWVVFKSTLSKARKVGQDGCRPDTLSDETREIRTIWSELGIGVKSYEEYAERVTGNIRSAFSVSKFLMSVQWIQDISFYAEVWYEAKAMSGQFQKYVPCEITLRPFGGDYSIPKKWEAAQTLRERARQLQEYGKVPKITVLYFGDLDKKGLSIARSALKDIEKWAMVDIDFHRIGLTKSQTETFHLLDNPERPGEYQWEALNDEQAESVIREGLALLPLHELKDARALADKCWDDWYKRYLGENPKIARLHEQGIDDLIDMPRRESGSPPWTNQ